ncbi:MAG: cell division protein FtsA [Candidatus Pacebacteria bacterium]|nr:cell division protein FtsA [Candidatus Paceibacterota bacterium]
MSTKIAVGIDIGTYQIKVVVASLEKGTRTQPAIIGTGFAESKGLRHGYVINIHEVSKALRKALDQAEKSSKIKIKRAFLSVGGIGLSGTLCQSSVIVSRGDSEITELDIKKGLDASENEIPQAISLNRKIIHVIPVQYKLDGKNVYGRPVGMKGTKLEIRSLFVSSLSQHLEDLIEAVEEAGVEVEDVMAAPLAASLVTLSRAQKIAGCVLANIGAETVSIVIFENNIPISLEVFPIGSTDITNDIALGLRVPLNEAEQIKLGGITSTSYPRKKLEEIIEARLSDIFELIEAHLKKIGKQELLPAGIILTGGGSGIGTVEDLAKAALKLPSKIGEVTFGNSKPGEVKDSTWAVAYGLCILGLNQEESASLGTQSLQNTKNTLISWIKQFLP